MSDIIQGEIIGWVIYLFCYCLIILLEFVLFIYVCSFGRVFIAVFYWCFEKFKEILQITKTEKQLQRLFTSTGTHWNSSNQDIFYVFMSFCGNQTILFFYSGIPCCFQIYGLDKIFINIVSLLYLGFIEFVQLFQHQYQLFLFLTG